MECVVTRTKMYCPRCKCVLDWDKEIVRYRCAQCGSIFSTEISGKKIIFREWKIMGLNPSNDDELYGRIKKET